MSGNRQIIDELRDLLWSIEEGSISDDGIARIDELVRKDETLLRQYVEYTRLVSDLKFGTADDRIHTDLSRVFGFEEEGSANAVDETDEYDYHEADDVCLAAESPHQPFASFPVLPSLSTNHHPLPSNFVGGPVFSYMVATVVLCAMLLGAWAYKVSSVDHFPIDTADAPKTNDRPTPFFVGQITGIKDCVWADNETSTIIGASIPLGRKYSLSSGLLELTYTSGARVILEGPCEYEVDSNVGGYLALGKLTARVDNAKPQAVNPDPRNSSLIPHPSSFFSVTTPTAIVTDLGTEFGVEVDERGDTSTHVFRGVVKVKIASLSGDKKGEGGGSVILRTDESARVEKDKTAVARLLTNVAIGDSAKFVRLMPRLSRINNFAFGKDSADFTWKYEMDVDPTTQDLDANPGPDWMLRFGAFQLNGDGTATLAASGERYGCLSSTGPGDFEHSAGHVWNNITESTGYTVELRIKVVGTVQWQGYELGMYFMTVDSTAEEYSHLVIARNNTLWDVNSRYLIDNHSNDDDFHTFRIAQAPNSGKFYVWRDCVLIRISEGFQSTRLNRIQFGDMGPRCGPNVVDYVRLTTGAHAPPKRAASPPMNTRPDNRKEAPSTINH